MLVGQWIDNEMANGLTNFGLDTLLFPDNSMNEQFEADVLLSLIQYCSYSLTGDNTYLCVSGYHMPAFWVNIINERMERYFLQRLILLVLH